MKAVILFNLGGPDHLDNVKPFLFNLFYDRAIINLPNPLRYMIAKLVSSRRNKTAQQIYKHLGGRSPIVPETQAQADELQHMLGSKYKVFISMRYWHPLLHSVLDEIKSENFDEIILMPLYPQYSTTTTGSFFSLFDRLISEKKININVKKICCYPDQIQYITACVNSIKEQIKNLNIPSNARYLFSAHGLPKKCIEAGDPYEAHVNITVQKTIEEFPEIKDHVVCYQSKVGPLEWIGPSTESEIIRAAAGNVPVAIIPISFVSENSETLYELDFEYKKTAQDHGLNAYYRLNTLRSDDLYIQAIADMIISCYSRSCSSLTCKFPCAEKKAA